MKSIQTKLILVISAIIIVVVGVFLLISTSRTNAILNDDSQDILISVADHYANIIDDNFRSTEQSVDTIYNYAGKRAETYTAFLDNEEERKHYTYDVSELGKSIAENTRGAMSVYLRYNPEKYGSTGGFWYTIDLTDHTWHPSVPTDMSLYAKDDLEHVGWYYIPVAAGRPMWMDPYYNANLGVSMLSYIIPYYHRGHTVGIIGMDISMDLLKEAVSKVEVYQTGRAFLIDRKGNVIYHEAYPDGANFKSLSAQEQAYFQSVLRMGMNSPDLFRALDGSQQKLILKELKNGMILGIYAPLQEINQPQRNLLTCLLGISALILALAIIVSLLWVRSITRPLQKMTSVAERYAEGDFSEEIQVHSQDEIGILSRSLQTMSTSLQEQIRLADSANKAKSDFLANMSHEIRTPINAILGMNEMILHEAQERRILDYSFNIKAAGKTLLSLVNTILDFSKIEDGKMEIIPVTYNMASAINNLVNSIQSRAMDKGLSFVVDVDENLPSVLWGDDIRITQVIMNLLTNAVKYTEKGTITFRVREQGREGEFVDLFFSVRDTGIGIRHEDIDRLFETFERIEEKRNRNIEGTGLGMAIVNRLLPMMGSALRVESVYGEGSEFSFVLRQKIVDASPIGNYAERLRSSKENGEDQAVLSAPDAQVLVVDDNETNLIVAENLLRLNGIVPELAGSGQEAIDKIREKDYDIVFLDHMMPKMDGIETLHELRRQKLLRPDTKVVALTANAIVGAKESYLAEGFDDYLSKPIEFPDLEALLLRWLPEKKAVPVVKEEPDEDYHVLQDAGIDSDTGLRYCHNDGDFYRSVLQNYAQSAADRKRDIQEAFDMQDWKNYSIGVHALKSTSKTIGATSLSEFAARMEAAGKEENRELIEKDASRLMEEYDKVVAAIRLLFPSADESISGDDDIMEFLPE